MALQDVATGQRRALGGVLASLLADRLGLPHADYELAQWRGSPGVVTPRFTEDGADLVHGNELLAERDPGYERAGARYVRTRLHTIDAVRSVLNSPNRELFAESDSE
jgi:hypothetical protein